MVFRYSWKELAEHGCRQPGKGLYHAPFFPDFHDAEPKSQDSRQSEGYLEPVFAEAKEALMIWVKTSVSPPMANLQSATTKAIRKKAIQI